MHIIKLYTKARIRRRVVFSVVLVILVLPLQAFQSSLIGGKLPWRKIMMASSSTGTQAQTETEFVDSEWKTYRHNFTTPYQILHPDFFDNSWSGYDRKLTLFSAMNIILKSVNRIVENEDLYHDNSIMRIEHVLGLDTDVLGWFDAQSAKFNGAWLFYFQNQQANFETAAIGSLLSVETKEIWGNTWDSLPHNSQLYGGARFDSESTVAQEWKEFGSSAWTLPVVELRRTVGADNGIQTTLAVHVLPGQAHRALAILQRLNDSTSPPIPPTTIPPVLSRNSNYGCMDGQELYEGSVGRALELLDDPNSPLEKVVLARRQTIELGVQDFTSRSIIRKWKYGGGEGGHAFYIRPEASTREFFGCSPERLFSVSPTVLESEALAGTRPRGSTAKADAVLLQELVDDPKDRQENRLTAAYIEETFQALVQAGLIEWTPPDDNATTFSVRRLLHLQHICQPFVADVISPLGPIVETLMSELHPTPAVCGVPLEDSRKFIRDFESIGFDRGWYSGPIGRMGPDSAELIVAIRSGLVENHERTTAVSVFAGAGIVPGSSVQGEWAETNYKFSVISSCFPQSPIVLSNSVTPNAAWATAFVEELIRKGVSMFYVCPGSRSTPLVVAISKAVRTNFGLIQAHSVHDERAAGFRALGYGRANGRPAAIITSSGTAISNLYPAVVEAGMDAVPMLILTADRPYEARDSGSNQSIDQVKHFSSSYVRWFRDIPPPSDEVPVSVALSDADHAVTVAREQRGPVHVNIQFRENLAPDSGPARGDDRVPTERSFNVARFTDAPGVNRWSIGGSSFSRSFHIQSESPEGVIETARLIRESKRGLIVVGNLRDRLDSSGSQQDLPCLISEFAKTIGFPIVAGVQSSQLRFTSSAVIPFAELLLKCDKLKERIDPDLIIQIGAPLVSTDVLSLVREAARKDGGHVNHILVHPHSQHERVDPSYTVTHRINSDTSRFLKAVMSMENLDDLVCGSELSCLVSLGRELRSEMADIVRESSNSVNRDELSEPEIVLALAETGSSSARSLFFSNSMPIRDGEFFFYPYQELDESRSMPGPNYIGANRGASGIDGIISSALGFAESTKLPTTLLIGDLATLHDLSSLHSLDSELISADFPRQRNPLTCIVVNNDGGGIFSFLPIAKYGDDVSFDEFFGTPTSSFSFEKGASAFGLSMTSVADYDSLIELYQSASSSGQHNMIEAIVMNRQQNVAVHQAITSRVENFVSAKFLPHTAPPTIVNQRLSISLFGKKENEDISTSSRSTLVLLHGWMGEKSDWEPIAQRLQEELEGWTIVSIDLPGHGESPLVQQRRYSALNNGVGSTDDSINVQVIAREVLLSLKEYHGVTRVDAIAGYSLGGRVAQAVRNVQGEASSLIRRNTKVILLSSAPIEASSRSEVRNELKIWENSDGDGRLDDDDLARIKVDMQLASEISVGCDRTILQGPSETGKSLVWQNLLRKWYSAKIWGSLIDKQGVFRWLKRRRTANMVKRGRDIGKVLSGCTPPLNRPISDVPMGSTFCIYGKEDQKYASLVRAWGSKADSNIYEVANVGHSLLSECTADVAGVMVNILQQRSLEDATALTKDKEHHPNVAVNENTMEYTQDVSDRQERQVAEEFQPDIEAVSSSCISISRINFKPFRVPLNDGRSSGVSDIGWTNVSSTQNSTLFKEGFFVEIVSQRPGMVAVGEISPLSGLHEESLDQVEEQLEALQVFIHEDDTLLSFADPMDILSLSGYLAQEIGRLAAKVGLPSFLPSVRFGLETALINLASQAANLPLNAALAQTSPKLQRRSPAGLEINGLLTKGSSMLNGEKSYQFRSIKVKAGQENIEDDMSAVRRAFAVVGPSLDACNVRVDANRAWGMATAISFVSKLEGLEIRGSERIEFVEEPLKKSVGGVARDDFADHVNALEQWYLQSGVKYALDETLFDMIVDSEWVFDAVKERLDETFKENNRGCAAMVLKPSLLGAELSVRLARLARKDYGMGAVFSSSFDTGVGLAYLAILADYSDRQARSDEHSFAHGLGTFPYLEQDMLSPPFGSYVGQTGQANVASLSRALYGLRLEELFNEEMSVDSDGSSYSSSSAQDTGNEEYEASTSMSSTGSEIDVVVSLPLPFSAAVACARFTDLPQQPRWSPWISSVECRGRESKWKVSVRGIALTWKATSEVVNNPWAGIRWESVSGLKNSGSVEFIPSSETDCQMKVRMKILPPRILQPLFRGTSVFIEDFLRDKLLKWSLEMFRDVVKADLAIERGDVELGDALFGAVEGKASAIEATLNIPPELNQQDSSFD